MRFSATRLVFGLLCLGCGDPVPLTVDMPLHLEDHLAEARVIGSDIPVDVPEPLEWLCDQPQPDWKATPVLSLLVYEDVPVLGYRHRGASY